MKMLMGLWVLVSANAFADASYSVPVPVELAAQATFGLPSAKWTAIPAGRKLSYSLPDDLVGGKAVDIELTGEAPVLADGLSRFSGDLASGGCTLLSETRVLCLVQYKEKAFGPDPEEFSRQARQFLEKKYEGSADLPNRLRTQGVFKNEPAGVVNLEIR